jgi:hypothetical protein
MNHRVILRVLGFIVPAVGAAMVPAAVLALLDPTHRRHHGDGARRDDGDVLAEGLTMGSGRPERR